MVGKVKLSLPTVLVSMLTMFLIMPGAWAAPKEIPAAEPFKGRVLADGLDAPWAMVWGPDNQIWLTERQGKKITRVDPKNGIKKVLATIEEAHVGPQHEGLLGLALAPDFLKTGSDNYLFVVYTYKDDGREHGKIVRFKYDAKNQKVGEPRPIIEKLPAGNDHNGGRLIFGPDGYLYYTLGEQGHNQWANICKPIEAQRLPTAQEVADKNWLAYSGKVLRLTTEGGIPENNPVLNGVKSHIFTYGHRNPQGLVFVGDRLFSSEQGPSSDDEINLLEGGGNYGWPHVAGFKDDQAYVYANWSVAPDCAKLPFDPNLIAEGVPIQKETDFNAENFKEPAKTFYTVPNGYNYSDEKCGQLAYLCWPTIAPASIDYYPADGPIKAWRNSLVVSSLKNGALYRLPLNKDRRSIQGDVTKYFHSQNRYRQVLIAPDGQNIYVATDVGGHVMDEDGLPVTGVKNPGSILVFEYQTPK